MEKPSISFFAMGFILLFVLISFIIIVFDLHRFAFVFELMLLMIFIFLIAFAMFVIYHKKKWGWTIIGATLVLLLLNTFFVLLLTKTLETAEITTIFFSVVGLAITLLNLRESSKQSDDTEIEEHYEKAKDYYPYIDKMEPEEIKEPNIEKTFTPGKFIASKKANKFHIAKCDWAKRISKSNQLWFNSEQEAKAHGFEADQCVI
ncbi:MAG: hypothetical protein Q8R04_00220 [Nanoarchaeota archaeon]|nr:hypothetical protein [Nanoarchaeota archaeon]